MLALRCPCSSDAREWWPLSHLCSLAGGCDNYLGISAGQQEGLTGLLGKVPVPNISVSDKNSMSHSVVATAAPWAAPGLAAATQQGARSIAVLFFLCCLHTRPGTEAICA